MPIYEYECSECGGRFEVVQKFSDPAPAACRLCNSTSVRKLLSPTAFVLKGSGWYATDYPSADRKKADEAERPKTEKPKEESTSKTGSSARVPPAARGRAALRKPRARVFHAGYDRWRSGGR